MGFGDCPIWYPFALVPGAIHGVVLPGPTRADSPELPVRGRSPAVLVENASPAGVIHGNTVCSWPSGELLVPYADSECLIYADRTGRLVDQNVGGCQRSRGQRRAHHHEHDRCGADNPSHSDQGSSPAAAPAVWTSRSSEATRWQPQLARDVGPSTRNHERCICAEARAPPATPPISSGGAKHPRACHLCAYVRGLANEYRGGASSGRRSSQRDRAPEHGPAELCGDTSRPSKGNAGGFG